MCPWKIRTFYLITIDQGHTFYINTSNEVGINKDITHIVFLKDSRFLTNSHLLLITIDQSTWYLPRSCRIHQIPCRYSGHIHLRPLFPCASSVLGSCTERMTGCIPGSSADRSSWFSWSWIVKMIVNLHHNFHKNVRSTNLRARPLFPQIRDPLFEFTWFIQCGKDLRKAMFEYTSATRSNRMMLFRER
jgi:hypothetical protein